MVIIKIDQDLGQDLGQVPEQDPERVQFGAAAAPPQFRNQCAISAARRARLAGFGKFSYRPFIQGLLRVLKEPFKAAF